MPAEYTVIAARNAGTKPNPHGGELVKWYLRLADSEAGEEDVYTQKKPGNDLSPGMSIYGRVEKGDYGWRFFSEQREDGSPGAPAARSSASTKEDYWDAKDRRIEWAWACNLAAAELAAPVGVSLDHAAVVERAREIRKQAREELSDADVGGGKDGRGVAPDDEPGTGSRLPHSQAVPTPAADVSADPGHFIQRAGEDVRVVQGDIASPQLKAKATQLMNKAGLAKGARQAVIMFRCGTLSDPPRDRLQSLVTDLEQGATHDTLLAEIYDAKRAGQPLGARAAAMIPSDTPVDDEGLPDAPPF